MSPEQLLLTGITAVTTALLWVSGRLWARSEACEKDREDMRLTSEKLMRSLGEREGELMAYKKCPEQKCPFKRPSDQLPAGTPAVV